MFIILLTLEKEKNFKSSNIKWVVLQNRAQKTNQGHYPWFFFLDIS